MATYTFDPHSEGAARNCLALLKIMHPALFDELFDTKCKLPELKFPPSPALLALEIGHLELPQRAINALSRDGINFIGQLLKHTEIDILKIPDIGRNTLMEICMSLDSNGLEFPVNGRVFKDSFRR